MITARRIVPVLLLALAATAPACLFDTREDLVQPPVPGGETVILDDHTKVFVAINKSFEDLSDANYERAISDQFIFSPLLQDSLDQNFIGTGVYDGWGKTREMEVLQLLLSDAQYITADFEPVLEINKTTNVRYRVTYELRVARLAAPTDTLRYRGVANFDIRNESGNWRLTYWDELEGVEGFASWGYLRGVLGLQLAQ